MRKSKNSKSTGKRETVEEFLARGGAITKCPPAILPEDTSHISTGSGVSSTIMSLAEGALYYSESKAKPKKSKKPVEESINKDALPASLLKYMPNSGLL